MGTYVDPNEAKKGKEPTEVFRGGWVDSSFDLLHGADVADATESISPAQLDELFGNDEEWPSTRPMRE